MAEEKGKNVPNRALCILAREVLRSAPVDETQLAQNHEETAQSAGETEEAKGPFDCSCVWPQVCVNRVNVPGLVECLDKHKHEKEMMCSMSN